MRNALVIGLVLLAGSALAAPAADRQPAEAPHPLLAAIPQAVHAADMKATVERLAAFGTRHTLSDTVSETRGIGAARRWVKSRFEAISKDCGGCLAIATPTGMVTGPRITNPAEIMDVLAVLPGTEDPGRVILIAGHLDSRVSDVMNAAADAPGANDDGSGTAAVIEAARVLSRHRYPATLVFAVLSGEEQGLFGGKLLAKYAGEQHWRVEADLNNDIMGNTHGENGVHISQYVRVFSEGTKSTETPAEAARRRYNGGEVDSPSRNLARFMAGLSKTYVKGLAVRMIYRTDRYSRGGDQVPMLAAGYPAVRVTEAIEDYQHQHQDVRTENGTQYGDLPEFMDFDYLARVTALDAVTMAALALAPAPPDDVAIEGAVGHDTKVSWAPVAGAAAYRVHWRDTLSPVWTQSRDAGAATSLTLKNVTIDDWFFGVSSVSKDGYESPVEFPGPAGAFFSEK